MSKELENIIKEINNDDLRTMFQTTLPSIILRDLSNATTELEEYLKYDVPVCLGDIVEFKGKNYCVTCIYTDNTVDILSLGEIARKENIGLYKKEITVIGKLQVIKED